MKKFTFLFIALLLSAFSWQVVAQTAGETCDNPIVVSLPFTASGDTADYGNNYGSADRPALAEGAIGNPGSSYLSGDDVVFAYTPSTDGFIDVTVTDHGTWAGVFVFTGCAFDSTVGGATNSSATVDLEVIGLPVEANETYYIVISTWAAPQSTPFTLNIVETAFDCPELNANIGDPCDDGDSTTANDVINGDCECEGEATTPGGVCGNPLVITELPYTTTDNTENYGDYYGASDVPPLALGAVGSPSSSYLNGDEVVYSYTPDADEVINISVTDHGSWAGVFVFTGCPFESTVGGHTNSSASVELLVEELPVETGVTYYIVISTFAAPQSTDYTLNITKFEDCASASAGVPDEVALMICAGTEFTIGVTGATQPASGLERVWQSSPAGDNDWTDIAGAFAESLTVASGVLEDTDYRYVVTCNPSSATDESDVIQVTVNPNVTSCYCESSATTVEAITYVSFGDIVNTTDASSNEGYVDFTTQSTEVDPGETYEITLKGNTSGNYTNHFTVFIDWNQNGFLDDEGEIYEIGSIQNSSGTDDISVIGNIEVPADALSGDTRMRIVKNFNSSRTNPCGGFSFGQVVDYTLNVTGDSGDTFPSPYCDIADAGSVTVEEITKVVFDETTITNDDTETVLINKTDTVVNVMQGETYTISVEGNTHNTDLNDFDNNIVAFIDWNQNGILDDEGEIYEIGVLTGSDGNDGISVTMDITVPMDAVEGPTRIRITKTYGDEDSTAEINPCGIEMNAFGFMIVPGYGQALDFTLEIVEGSNEGVACSEENPNDSTFENGFNCSSAASFKTANDLTVAADEDFTLTNITASIFANGGISNVDVIYYDDNGGLPGAIIGSEISATIDNQSVIGDNFGFDVNEIEISVDPFIFSGRPGISTKYWIQLSVTDGGSTASVFWVVTSSSMQGSPAAQYGEDEVWGFDEDNMNMDGVYIWDGICSPRDPGEDCSGTPDAGIASVTPETGGPSSTYIVSNANHTAGNGLTYQWQSNTDGAGWVDEGDMEVYYSAFTATAPDEIEIEVEWRLEVTCTLSEETSYSDIATFTTALDYCSATSSTVEPITRVIFAGIDNVSSPTSTAAYEDFTAIMGQVDAGETYSFAAEGNTGGGWTNHFTVWVDWNQNGEFEPSEMYEIGSINGSTGTDGQQAVNDIEVPSDAATGDTRMRVRKNFSTPYTDPCGSNSYGQTEDYTITVGELDDCSGIPDAGVAMVDPEEGVTNSTYTVSATGYSTGNGITYQWQSNTDEAGWINEEDAQDTYYSYMATAPADSNIMVEWRLEVTCTLSEETSYSETATFTTTEASSYCIPLATICSDGDLITNVTFQEINNTTDCSADGYGDYTSIPAAIVGPGNTYPISVTVGGGFTSESVSVWIDFNENGIFDEDEFFFIGSGSAEVITGDISIPADATNGDYRMRVRVAAAIEDLATWDMSCGDVDQPYGETEDYTVTVDEGLSTGDYAISDFKYYPNPMTDVLHITANEDIKSVSVFNVLGQEVLSNKHFTNGEVDATSLSTGTYLFRVTFDNGHIENFKVLKK